MLFSLYFLVIFSVVTLGFAMYVLTYKNPLYISYINPDVYSLMPVTHIHVTPIKL